MRAIGWFSLGAVLMLIGLGLLIWQFKWARDLARGPVPITEAELANLTAKGLPESYLAFDANEVKETGLGVKQGKSGSWKARYLLLKLENRWVVATVPADFSGKRVVGYLRKLDDWDAKFDSNAMEQIRTQFPQHTLAPFYLRSRDEQGQFSGFMICIMLLFLVGAGCVLLGFIDGNKREETSILTHEEVRMIVRGPRR